MQSQLSDILDRAKGTKVICLGDVMLDRFVYGTVGRISPEAPVPVLRKNGAAEMAGGAGNVARNLAAMGLQVALFGVVGRDEFGRQLSALLDEEPGMSAFLAQSPQSQTVVKTRFVSQNQQLLRVDTEDSAPDTSDVESDLIESVRKELQSGGYCAMVISDYAKGTVTPDIMKACVALGREHMVPVLVDPKHRDFSRYAGASVLKPNAAELSAATGLPCDDDVQIEAALRAAQEQVPGTDIIVTRAGKGMSWIEAGVVHHKRGEAREVYDVSGAGDTSMAAIALGRALGEGLETAVSLAVTASGIAVGKTGTATVSADEIRLAASSSHHPLRAPILSRELLARQCEAWRKAGHRIGFTNGCFDILHPGHLKLVEEASLRCDKLIVAINSDPSVKRLKGDSRPVNNEVSRASLLSALGAVDAVTVFDEDTPAELIDVLVPDLLVKGGDYTIEQIVGAETVLAAGGEVHIVDIEAGHSTTAIIARSSS